MARLGRGGILSSLVAGLAGHFFGPVVSSVATGIADALPI